MRPKTLLILLLFMPYLIWLVAIQYAGLPFDSPVHTLAAGFSLIYGFGILFWGIPYTTLVVGILFWSRGRSSKELYDALSRSPVLLAWITLAEFVLAYLIVVLVGIPQALSLGVGNQLDILEIAGGLFGSIFYALMAMVGIFIYGYIFVFLAKGVYGLFERWNWFKGEENIPLDP